jgi:hypothetical protein
MEISEGIRELAKTAQRGIDARGYVYPNGRPYSANPEQQVIDAVSDLVADAWAPWTANPKSPTVILSWDLNRTEAYFTAD